MLPLIIFFLSGFAALVYQVIWQRLLVIFSGADVYSITVIVAAFMGGLGAGSLAGGHLADRFGPRRSLYAFALAELLVGLFGVVSKPLYYDTLYGRYAHLASTQATSAAVLISTLLLPTFLMGVSLPLLTRALAGSLQVTPRIIALLYGCNTLGAATGAIATPWILIPRFGLEWPLWVAAAVNALCAALALGLALRTSVVARAAGAPDAPPPESAQMIDHLSFRAWVAVFGLTGFIALGLEIAWFRLLGVLLKSTSFTFGTLLAVYLGGLGAGATMGARFAARGRSDGTTFLVLQYGVTLYAAVSTTLLVAVIAAGHPARLAQFLGSYEPVNVHDTFARALAVRWSDLDGLRPLADLAALYLAIPAALIGPPTLLMGMSFPYLQKAAQADFARIGRRLGSLLASNIAGGVLGAMAVGWVLLPWLGTAGTLRLLVACGALLAWPWARLRWPTPERRRVIGVAGVVAATATAVLAMPGSASLWSRLHGTRSAHVLFDEDGSGLSLLKLERPIGPGAVEVYVNGLGQSWLPYGNIHTALGALPAFIHPAPAEVALIGLGSGDTAFGIAGRAEIQRIVSIEILGAQRRTLERLLAIQRYPGLLAVLSDPRIEQRVGDGRAYLNQSGRQFDIIEADALRPSSAYAGNLYSREYFRLVLRQLRPGGLGVAWAPTGRIQATFLSVFPYALAFHGDIFIGSNAPIRYDPAEVTSRAIVVRHYYDAAGVDIVALLHPYLQAEPVRFAPGDVRPSITLNTDLSPRDEFALPF